MDAVQNIYIYIYTVSRIMFSSATTHIVQVDSVVHEQLCLITFIYQYVAQFFPARIAAGL